MLKIIKWFLMLSKRLYKKPSFVVLLALIPTCIFAFSMAAKQNSGFVHISLAQTNKSDAISTEIINSLLDDDSLIKFTYAPNSQAAIDNVKKGLADEAWVFNDNTEEMINDYINNNSKRVVSIFTKEQNVSVRLAREKLTGELYKYCAKSYYIDYIRANVSELSGVSDEKLGIYFENTSVDGNLFNFNNPSNTSNSNNTNYLTSPIRGLLAVFALLCGLAATMYFKQDDKNGTFSYIRSDHKPLVEFGCILTAVINLSIVLLLSLCFSSLAGSILKEIITLILYAICCTSFCMLLGQIFKNLNLFSVITPLVTIIVIGVCPIFFDFRSIYALQLLFPPTYYANSIFSNRFIPYMILYSADCISLFFALKLITKYINIWKRSHKDN